MEVVLPPPDLDLTIYGLPAPKGSKRAFAIPGGRAVVVDDNKPTLKSWVSALQSVMQAEAAKGGPVLDEALEVHVDFFMPKPKSAPKIRRTWPSKKPDLDKLLRALWDVMVTSRLIYDDSRIVKVVATKDFPLFEERPRAEVRVWRMAELYPEGVTPKHEARSHPGKAGGGIPYSRNPRP